MDTITQTKSQSQQPEDAGASGTTTMNFAQMEETICELWKKENIFAIQDKLCLDRKDKEYTFYDGPPFATGLPHYGHILAGTIKDTVTRYAVMTGHYVLRRAGWDCHGLPVEYEIDQMLNITHRQQVYDMGIDKYNETCQSIVLRYTKEWEYTITRLGRWIQFDNDYKTMDVTFMESVWWVFQTLYQKGLVYQGFKVMPYSTACTTPLSNFEAGLNYKDVKDPAIVVSFPLVEEPEVSLLAWTTTPWTLPSNIALCVHPEMTYVQFQDVKTSKIYIMSEKRLCQLYPIMNNKKKWKPEMASEYYLVLKKFIGKDLFGKRYIPLFDYYVGKSPQFFQIVSDTYVTDDAGTGIVHQAPAFGEDDYRVCLFHQIISKGDSNIPCPVDDDGQFTDVVDIVKGLHVKQADDVLIQYLKDSKQRLVQKDILEHSYPFCWRSDTPLIYKIVPSYFVKVEDIKEDIVKNNMDGTYWVPNDVKMGRFHNWLADARDWAISRNRFWGTPIPIWINETKGYEDDIICVGSIAELETLTNSPAGTIDNIHRDKIDHLVIPSTKYPGTVLRRIEDVFDCWFESGSMPYAQNHYPFAKDKEFHFPADFIAEGLDQTRGWFYTLMVLSTALFQKPAFKNNIVNGMVLAADGQKMSKRKKNYPDPIHVIQKYGADALRLYLINSPVVRGEALKFREDGVLAIVKEVFLPWYNAFRFFQLNVTRWMNDHLEKPAFIPNDDLVKNSNNPTDIWILAETQELIQFVHKEMTAYRLYTVVPVLISYGTQLTNWYVRLNRERFKGNVSNEEGSNSGKDDTEIGLQVLYYVLLNVTILMAPFTPYLTEYFYQHLRQYQPSYHERLKDPSLGIANPVIVGKSDSVHFLPLPTYDATLMNHNVVEVMKIFQTIIEHGRNSREKRSITLKFPVKQVVVVLRNRATHITDGLLGPFYPYLLSELNTYEFTIISKEDEHHWVKLSLSPNFKSLGKRLGKKMKNIQQHITSLDHQQCLEVLEQTTIMIDDEEIEVANDLESKLLFSKTSDNGGDSMWESSCKIDGSLVVAIDCTQDEQIQLSGISREIMKAVQQLRKNAKLDIRDIVEIFYHMESEESTLTPTEEQQAPTATTNGHARAELDYNTKLIEKAVEQNKSPFELKFKGYVPLHKRYAPSWSVSIISDTFELNNGISIVISLSRPAISVPLNTSLPVDVLNVLSTMDPAMFQSGEKSPFVCEIEDPTTKSKEKHSLAEGVDFFTSTYSMVKATRQSS